ncbi:MAG: S41 family peptidase [Solirubrobacteraceae bacterium]
MSPRPSRWPYALGAPALAVVALLAGIWLGGHSNVLPGWLQDVAGNRQTALVNEALDLIQDDYYRKVSRSALVNRGLQGAVKSLDDRFSNYFDPKSYRQFQQQTDPRFSGVGLNVRQDPKGLEVLGVFRGSPAQRAGIRPLDLITGVDGRSLAGKPSDYATALIRGRPGTAVRLTVSSGGRSRTLRIRRARISVPVVTSRLISFRGRKIGYVELASFTQGAGDQVRQAVARLLRRGASGIVLDLRGNGGGLLDESVSVASVFIPEGTVVSTRGRSRPRRVYDATGGAIPARIPVVVLVDHGTASASEIVSGALQDRHRAKIVGTRTFGKGVFQEIKPLSNGGALDITVGQYFLPSGRNLGGPGVREGAGIHPNVPVPGESPRTRADEALDAGLATLARELPAGQR